MAQNTGSAQWTRLSCGAHRAEQITKMGRRQRKKITFITEPWLKRAQHEVKPEEQGWYHLTPTTVGFKNAWCTDSHTGIHHSKLAKLPLVRELQARWGQSPVDPRTFAIRHCTDSQQKPNTALLINNDLLTDRMGNSGQTSQMLCFYSNAWHSARSVVPAGSRMWNN